MLRLDKFERYPLTFGPTPIEHLPRMTAALGAKVEIYAKREDCNSGLAMGGNKLRKLECIVPDAIASNADTLVSIGGVQSNHTRMVAATAAKIGMKCVVIQESWVPHEDAVYDRVGNILLTRLMGADSRIVPDGFDIGIRKSWPLARHSSCARRCARSSTTPPSLGGRDPIREGRRGQALCDSSGRVSAQIWWARLCRLRRGSARPGERDGHHFRLRHCVRGHRIDPSWNDRRFRFRQSGPSGDWHRRVELGRAVRDDEMVILEDYASPAYGVPSRETSEAIRFAARTEAMITDPVYEGKSMQGMIDLVKKGFFPEGSKVLYAHLGGAPAINGYSYIYRNG